MDLNEQFKQLHIEYQINPCSSYTQRKKILLALKSALQTNAYHLVDAVNSDYTHRSGDETLFLEIFPTIKAIDYCVKNMKRWMKTRRRKVSWMFLPARACVCPQPLGVVGNIAPWNYPVYLALVPAIYALAAGNKIMIKMSELSVNTGLALANLIDSIDMGAVIKIINGDVEVSREFANLPFGHLLFTGSTAVGKSVMKSASANLTPVTLELGGKSPAIISASVNVGYFKRLFMGKLYNAGQTCIAPDYLLIPSGWAGKIEQAFKEFIDLHYPDLMNNNNYSSIISNAKKQRLLEIIRDAQQKGARVVEFGETNPNSNKMPFYLLFSVTNDMKVMHEEIFGPVLPVLSYKSLNEAVEYVNSFPNPLALYYFGDDKAEVKFIRSRTLSGALTINDTLMHVAIDDLPFGGVGQSGMGSYHGQEGFDTFSNLKPVYRQGRFSSVSWFYPPYGKLMRTFLHWVGGIRPRGQND